jgi:hypothetical protein
MIKEMLEPLPALRALKMCVLVVPGSAGRGEGLTPKALCQCMQSLCGKMGANGTFVLLDGGSSVAWCCVPPSQVRSPECAIRGNPLQPRDVVNYLVLCGKGVCK